MYLITGWFSVGLVANGFELNIGSLPNHVDGLETGDLVVDFHSVAIISGLYGSLLKPGGYFIHTFSNRWFPPKVVRIWTELLEWERPGLVLEYFLGSGSYDRINTFSARGWPRPVADRYFPQMPVSDPVYAVWGQTRE